MRERYDLLLKIACAVLAALLLVQTGRVLFRQSPLKNLQIPALPVLASAADSATPGKGTNSATVPPNMKGKTNSPRADSASAGTNGSPALSAGKTNSNLVTGATAAKAGTNDVADHPPSKIETNGTGSSSAGSNSVANLESGKVGTNSVNRTNLNAQAKGPGSRPDAAMMAMMMGGPPGRAGGKKGSDLVPAVQARVDKIVESEILGPVFHPMPMGLLGIAGNSAFLRSPSGQTGLVKEGDELGGIKLLRIGTNRVLVEQSGEKKELTIFSGYGSETLMPKEKDKTNEPSIKHP
jgi:hypothetical protein